MYCGRGFRRPENSEDTKPGNNSTTNIDIPNSLVREYKAKIKNPVSVIQEYCTQKKFTVRYQETYDSLPIYGGFGCQCYIENFAYKPGQGQTKKAAKTEAAINAVEHLIQFGRSPSQVIEPKNNAIVDTKNATWLLNNYSAKNNLNITIIDDGKHDNWFKTSVYKDGNFFCSEYAHSKNASKVKASEKALSMLISNQDIYIGETHFDLMRRLVLEKLTLLNKFNISTSRCAGFVILKHSKDRGMCVALATGDCCPSNQYNSTGRMIIDGHAVVMARRSFIKYLYKELQACVENAESIFEEYKSVEGETSFRLKELVSVHLYTSHAPCGDALEFTQKTPLLISQDEWNKIVDGRHKPNLLDKSLHGRLRQKELLGTKTTAIKEIGEKKGLMSCSDKMLKWNVLGLQGAILASHIDPIYLNTVTLGNNFEMETLVRAICCRYSDDILEKNLPQLYKCWHPIVGRVSVYDFNQSQRRNASFDQLECGDASVNQSRGWDSNSDASVNQSRGWDSNNDDFIGGSEYANELNVAAQQRAFSNGAPLNNLALNFCVYDQSVEIVDVGVTGLTDASSPFKSGSSMGSRLCKAANLFRYQSFLKSLNHSRCSQVSQSSYLQVKQSSEIYQQAKGLFEKQLIWDKLGAWSHLDESVNDFKK